MTGYSSFFISLFQKVKSSRLLFVVVTLLMFGGLTGCDLARNYTKADRDASMETQDFRDGLAPRDIEGSDDSASAAGIPELQPYIAPASSNLREMPLVSISVNQSVPLRDVLYELAQQAEYDLELDPRIRGSIIFTARQRPLDVVIERIAKISGLRYSFEDDILRVEVDTPYNKFYRIDYLSYIRSNNGSVRNSVAVVSGEGADTGSAFEMKSESVADFWGELDSNLKQITSRQSTARLRTARDPRLEVEQQNPGVQAVGPSYDENGQVQVQAPDAVLRVDSLPLDEENIDNNNGDGPSDVADQYDVSFTINRQAGIISVFAPKLIHDQVEEYMKRLKRAVTAQVLIEAKIMEVTLSDEFRSGINWRAVDVLSGEGILQFGNLTTLGAGAPPASGDFAVGFLGNDIQALVQSLSTFGTVRALASPRLTVLNNQSALLNVATNRVFFEIDIDVTQNDTQTQTEIDSDIRNIPEGVLVNVQPSINLDDRTISMAVRPTITSVEAEIQDPAVAFVAETNNVQNIQNLIPQVNVQEIDSVIKMRSGQAVVMGGLLQDRVSGTTESVPVLGEMPLVGALFRNQSDLISKTELVILLKATIVDGDESVHETDKDLYRTFSGDRRPFKL